MPTMREEVLEHGRELGREELEDEFLRSGEFLERYANEYADNYMKGFIRSVYETGIEQIEAEGMEVTDETIDALLWLILEQTQEPLEMIIGSLDLPLNEKLALQKRYSEQ